jgi:hypothetical protein
MTAPGPAPLKRTLTPALNPTGLGSAIAAVYAAVVMVWNATHHHAVIDPQVVLGALGAAAFLYTRFKVTPVSDPRDGNGQRLAAVQWTAGGNTTTASLRVPPSGMSVPGATVPPEPPSDGNPGVPAG